MLLSMIVYYKQIIWLMHLGAEWLNGRSSLTIATTLCPWARQSDP